MHVPVAVVVGRWFACWRFLVRVERVPPPPTHTHTLPIVRGVVVGLSPLLS